MKTRHECTNRGCKYSWFEDGPQETCPECGSGIESVNIINFLEPGQGNNSAQRTVCYALKGNVLTGRAPEKIIQPGIILTGIPYLSLQKNEYMVDDVKYREHKGAMSHLFHWTAKITQV